MDVPGVTRRYVPVKIVVAPVMEYGCQFRHDPAVVAAHLIGTAAREPGDTAPDAKFLEEQIPEFIQIVLVYFLRTVNHIIFMLIAVKGERVPFP